MIRNIIFDFDGVILDSVPVKTEAFRSLFAKNEPEDVDDFIRYHLENGGKSRYLKIKYFYEDILQKPVSDEEVIRLADQYSDLTKEELSNTKYLIEDAFKYIQENHSNFKMHVASGADEKDLQYICNQLDIDKFFVSIHGSPTPKDELIKNILEVYGYDKENTIMIGDSINDYEAAMVNGIRFYGYNNKKLIDKERNYISSFSNLI